MDENEQEMISIPRRKAFNEDKVCCSWAHMSLKVLDLERTGHIALETHVNSCTEQLEQRTHRETGVIICGFWEKKAIESS